MDFDKDCLTFFGAIAILLIVFTVEAAIVMAIWNWTVAELLGLLVLTYWKSIGLTLLCKLLFGGIRVNSTSKG